jgi:tungstate transport system ATP-binding protein
MTDSAKAEVATSTAPCISPLFALQGLTASFGDKTVLSVDHLQLWPAQVTVVHGENGSGKTTLLRLLNGLLTPSAGVLLYRGAPLAPGLLARLRAESVLAHQSPLLFRGSVWRNVSYAPKVRGLSRAEIVKRVTDSLARVGLDGYERRRASELSGGEKQRVALARALATNAEVLLLDEPTTHLDAQGRRLVEGLVRKAAEAGATVIMSAHDREFTYRSADRIIEIDAGKILAGRENVWHGQVAARDDQFVHFRAGPCMLKAPAQGGEFCVAVLSFDDVLLSRQPLQSSARNHLGGRIAAMESAGNLWRVTVDCGIPIRTMITDSAAQELQVENGRDFVVTFKASAVRLY